MFEFFDTIVPENEEYISNARAEKIRSSVLSRIEEDKPMKKHFTIKPLLVAAAIMTTGAISVISAGAATNTNVSDLTAPQTAAQSEPVQPAEPAAEPVQDSTPVADPEPAQEITPAPPKEEERPTKGINVDKLVEEGAGEIYEANGHRYMMLEEKESDMELIGVDADGTRHYKSRFGGTASSWSADGDYDSGYFGIIIRLD